jgi:hypothetical protein
MVYGWIILLKIKGKKKKISCSKMEQNRKEKKH